MKAFWIHVGKGLASVAKYAAKAALWASHHQAVVTTLAGIAGHPEVAAVLNPIGSVINKVTESSK